MSIATSPDGVTYFNVEEHYRQSEEYEAAMMYLDSMNVPKSDNVGMEYSLVGRIEAYAMLKARDE